MKGGKLKEKGNGERGREEKVEGREKSENGDTNMSEKRGRKI